MINRAIVRLGDDENQPQVSNAEPPTAQKECLTVSSQEN